MHTVTVKRKPSQVSAPPQTRQTRTEAVDTPRPQATQPLPVESPLVGTPLAYAIDALQRGILFWDVIRKRANSFLEHEAAGLPPVLNFDYELILDARHFERPANYALLKVNAYGDTCMEDCLDQTKPPIIIVDPRAGHGPGIGGFKRESEVGIAFHQGHPVYFVIFFPAPQPHQTVADVLHALRRFVEEVAARHPGTPPVLYGNCQAGWLLALLSAECQGLAGPAVLCGSPLSYWSGREKSSMQLEGGLCGGAWLTRFLADLGNGEFDGAWLIANFETLNPAQALWSKYYDLYAKVDTEEERFLAFERWWNGFYRFSTEEIVATVAQLFIGNEIETGEVTLHEGCTIDLKHIRNPLLIFASEGDAITPPYQALGWIGAVYRTTEALKAAKQRIAYLVHPTIGHLGIFVSAEIARREHNAILGSLDALEALPPGLYEMRILEGAPHDGCEIPAYQVRFEERRIEDIRMHQAHPDLERVKQLSEYNDMLYSALVSPWVRLASNAGSAAALRWLHPLRLSRYVWSEWNNPAMWGVATLAPVVRANRVQVPPDDPLRKLEGEAAKCIAEGLQDAKKAIDDGAEAAFHLLYGQHGRGDA